MKFVVASYGPKHVGMLLTHLHSIAKSHPTAGAAIYWQDIPDPLVEALQTAFPHYDFRKTNFDFSKDFILRISSKVHAWCQAAEDEANEPRLCLADVDTLILKNIDAFFEKDEADVIYTHKPQQRTALNTGVLLSHGRPAATAFFREWRDQTLRICRTPELYAQANDYSLGYGASDQMALWQMLNYQRDQAGYEISLGGQSVRFRGEPCTVLNETDSVPVTDEKHILHYKAGWQPILLQGRPFTKNRPRDKSWPMFTLYLQMFREALTNLNTTAGTRYQPRDFGMVIPAYFDVETGGFDSTIYALWRAREAGKSALRTLRYAAHKLTGGAISNS